MIDGFSGASRMSANREKTRRSPNSPEVWMNAAIQFVPEHPSTPTSHSCLEVLLMVARGGRPLRRRNCRNLRRNAGRPRIADALVRRHGTESSLSLPKAVV